MEQSPFKYIGAAISDHEILQALPENYRLLLNQSNGFILFEGGLHIRGAVLTPEWHSIRNIWFGEHPLHQLYSAIHVTDVPFGQDCLGDQFILRSDSVHRLSGETGELEDLRMNLEAFLEQAQDDPLEFLSLRPLQQFINEGGSLAPGQLLNVYPPFCTAESRNGVSLRAIAMGEQISYLADLAQQLSMVSEGAKVQMKVINKASGEI